MNREQYNDIVKDFSDILYRYCIMMVRNCPLSQDIVQDCFLSLWKNRHNVDSQKAKSYLISAAYHIIVSYCRKKAKESKYIEEIEEGIAKISYDGSADAVNYYLDRLPKNYKDALVLRDMQGYSYQDIASIMSCSVENVKITIYRARKMMKELITNKEDII